MFNIRTSRDFYEKLLGDFVDLHGRPDSARFAINCAITAYHMHEWVWGDWLNKDHKTWSKLGIRDKDSFLSWMDQNAWWFRAVQDLTNGSKHFNRAMSQQTQVTGAFSSAAFDRSAFDATRLEVEVERDGRNVWIEALVLIETAVVFWRSFLIEHGPYRDLPMSNVHLTEFR